MVRLTLSTMKATFITYLLSLHSPTTVSNDAVAAYIAATFVVSFSLGMMVATIITSVCYIARKSPSQKVYQPPLPLPPYHQSICVPSEHYDAVTGDQKMKDAPIELESNNAYGTVQ